MKQCLATLVLVLAWWGLPRVTLVDAAGGRHGGRIVFQQQPFAEFSSSKELAKIISKAARNTSIKRDSSGTWLFHFIAFFKRKPGAKSVNLVWYTTAQGKAEQVDYTEFSISADQPSLQAKVELTKTGGFKPDTTYEARITRLVAGKEIILAKARVLFK
jgi:hypothetical protein